MAINELKNLIETIPHSDECIHIDNSKCSAHLEWESGCPICPRGRMLFLVSTLEREQVELKKRLADLESVRSALPSLNF